jgi:hypothetical protein
VPRGFEKMPGLRCARPSTTSTLCGEFLIKDATDSDQGCSLEPA